MRRASIIAAGIIAAVCFVASGNSAAAGFGAVAIDEHAAKYGFAWNEPTQDRANETALKQCGTDKCKVHSVGPKHCGALAVSDKDKAWGGAERDTLDEAKTDAIAHCQTHTPNGQCKVRGSGCNS